jgi:hypothetical protein
VITTSLAWNYVVDVHLALICATYLTEATITHEHAFALFAVSPTVQLV